jgi:Tol biopolymer transport system component
MVGLGSVPNSGLQLPIVSPDGRWITYLRADPDEGIYSDALISGKKLANVALVVRGLHGDTEERVVCASGAGWGVWSPDSKRLLFIVYDGAGGCALGTHDMLTARTHRRDVGFKHMIMPAISPTGRELAAVTFSQQPDQRRLSILNLETSTFRPNPPPEKVQGALWPQWIDDRTLIYLKSNDGGMFLHKWTLEQENPKRLYQINAPNAIDQTFQIFAGIAAPVSPDGRKLAYYDTAADHIVLLDLATGERRGLKPHTRAGCWLGHKIFAAATDKELLLGFIGTAVQKSVLRGGWLPRRGNPATNQIVLCTRGGDPWTFQIVRVELLPTR